MAGFSARLRMSGWEVLDTSRGFSGTRQPKPFLPELRSLRDVNDPMLLQAATPSC